MSSEISTSATTAAGVAGVPGRAKDDSLHPWQLFVLAALGCATVATFMARGGGTVKIVFLAVLMGSAALVGLAALRAVRPLMSPDEDRTSMIGERTRAALEREKMLVLRSIKELEFDHAMGKVSDADWHEMAGRLRSRAAGLIRRLDAGSGYRDQIERDLAGRLGQSSSARAGACAQCGVQNDVDARFCKGCGSKL